MACLSRMACVGPMPHLAPTWSGPQIHLIPVLTPLGEGKWVGFLRKGGWVGALDPPPQKITRECLMVGSDVFPVTGPDAVGRQPAQPGGAVLPFGAGHDGVPSPVHARQAGH